jgi:tetratricopeptide (TPR) repeat protein
MWTDLHRALVLSVVAWLACAASIARAEESGPWSAPHLQGVEAYQAGDYQRAVEAFEYAQQLGAPPSNLYNLARCYEQLDRPADALRTYEQYLESPELPEERRVRAQELRDGLAALPGQVTVRVVPAGAELFVDDEMVEHAGDQTATLSLTPGPHTIEARLENHTDASESIEVAPAGEHEVTLILEPTPLPEPEPEPREEVMLPGPLNGPASEPRPWVGAGIMMGGGLLLAVVGGALDIAAYARAEEPRGFDDVVAYHEWYDSVGRLALAGDILLGLGAVTVITGLIWMLAHRARGRRTVGDAASAIEVRVGQGIALSAAF